MKENKLLTQVLYAYEDRFELTNNESPQIINGFIYKAIKKHCPVCKELIYWNNPKVGDIEYCSNCSYEIQIISLSPIQVDLTNEWKEFATYFGC